MNNVSTDKPVTGWLYHVKVRPARCDTKRPLARGVPIDHLPGNAETSSWIEELENSNPWMC